MKIRLGFVTNSSSHSYVVKNTTRSTKTMVDLLREASTNEFGPWEAMPECYLGEDTDYLDFEDMNKPASRRNMSHARVPVFLQEVAASKSFPPGVEVHVEFQWGFVDALILLIESPRRTKSFKIDGVDQ